MARARRAARHVLPRLWRPVSRVLRFWRRGVPARLEHVVVIRTVVRVLESQVGATFIVAVACALLTILFDIVVTRIPSPFPDATAYVSAHLQPERRQLLNYFLASVPASLVVTLLTYAEPAIAQYANPATLLLYGRPTIRPVPWPIAYVAAHRNPLWSTQTLAVSFGAAAFALGVWMDDETRGQVLTVVVLAVTLGLASLISVFTFVHWVMRMRIPDAAIDETRALALRLVRHAAAWRGLRRPQPRRGLRYPQQAHVAALVDALTQAALRTRVERHPATVRSLAALRDIGVAALSTQLPARWYEVNMPGTPARVSTQPATRGVTLELWLEGRVISSLGAVLVDAARTHDATTTRYAAERLAEASTKILERERTERRASGRSVTNADEQLLGLCLEQYRVAFLACVDVGEFDVRHVLVVYLQEIIGQLLDSKSRRARHRPGPRLLAERPDATRISPWPEAATRLLTALLGQLAGPCAEKDDAAATESVLALMARVADAQLPERGSGGGIDLASLRTLMLTIAIELLGVALATRSFRAGGAVFDWLARQGQDRPALSAGQRDDLRVRLLGGDSGGPLAQTGTVVEGLVEREDVRRAFVFAVAAGTLGPWTSARGLLRGVALRGSFAELERDLTRLLAHGSAVSLPVMLRRIASRR